MSTSLIATPPPVLRWLQLDVPVGQIASQTPGSNGDADLSGAPSPGTRAGTSAGPIMASDWHILVVDDEPDIRTMLRALLQYEGYIVSDAVDGVAGLAHLRASARSLIVLLDYKMPHMNGEELLEAVMADPHLAHRHAFIFVTANLPAFSPALQQLLTHAAIPVVQKPFRISEILDEIERAIVRLQTSSDPNPPAP